MDRLYIVCVLYNQKIEEITSLNVFLSLAGKYSFIKLMVMDNSSKAFLTQNRRACETTYKGRIRYVESGGNIGISKAYNKALRIIKDEKFHVMWSDDDTLFSEEYLENVIKSIKAGRTDIISGIVRANGNVISPVKNLNFDVFKRTNRFDLKPGIHNNIYCINTGLTIKSSVFDAVGGYDERLFLDAVDHLFSDQLIEKGLNRIEIVSGSITQDFAAETDDLSAWKKRVRIYVRDWTKWWMITRRHGVFILLNILLINLTTVKKWLKNKWGISISFRRKKKRN